MTTQLDTEICQECDPLSLICDCGKTYKYLGSLNKHKQKCKFNDIKREKLIDYKELYEQSLIRNKNLEKLIIQIVLELKKRGVDIEFIS
jgi:uncharacterized HAD superfamily protein